MQLRKALFAALATLPLLAGGAAAHGSWNGPGYGPPHGHDSGWREREARRAFFEAERARRWEWERRMAWQQQRYIPPPPPPTYGMPGGWGRRW
jgi:hypothetical protein